MSSDRRWSMEIASEQLMQHKQMILQADHTQFARSLFGKEIIHSLESFC